MFLLFAIFAVCIAVVLFTGADAYKRLVVRGQNAYGSRTVPQYLATKLRSSDAAGAVAVAGFGQTEALELRETINGEVFITRIYCHDGYVKELYCSEKNSYKPEDGEKIMEAESLRFWLEEGCLTIYITQKDGEMTEQKLMLRSAEGGSLYEK